MYTTDPNQSDKQSFALICLFLHLKKKMKEKLNQHKSH
jgi:hypothetical protein